MGILGVRFYFHMTLQISVYYRQHELWMFFVCVCFHFVKLQMLEMSLDSVGSQCLPVARVLGAALCESSAQFIGLMMLENNTRMSPAHSRQHRKGLDIKYSLIIFILSGCMSGFSTSGQIETETLCSL